MVKAKAKAKAAAKAKAHAKAKATAKAKARPARTKNWTNHALEASFSFVFYSSCLVKHVTASYVMNVPVEVEFSQIWQILGAYGSSVETLIRCDLRRRLMHEK